jgi:SWI/SNF-related matrix-associated actin-dependent regulator 1 of chromatin subfamily A
VWLMGVCARAKSCKTSKLRDMLRAEIAARRKTLVFSQMTRLLDIVEVVLHDDDIEFVRLDGSTPIDERQPLIDRFNSSATLCVFLLSTRAGGLGINLASAETVIFYDISFNPQVERQVSARECVRVRARMY